MTRLGRWLTAVLVAAGVSAAPPLLAQQAHASARPTRVAVTIALLDTASATPFQIVRRVNGTPRDVILLPRGANADDLSAAVHELLLMRRLQGDTAQATGVMRVRRPNGGSPHQMPRYPWAARVLIDIQSAPRKVISGVGLVPAVEIWLPRQRGRARSP